MRGQYGPLVWFANKAKVLASGGILFADGTTQTTAATGGGAVDSVNGQTGVVVLVKSDISLSNVDNTSDATKNAASVALTNHSIDADANTLTNIENADIKAAAAIAVNKLAATTASRALVSDGSGFVSASATTSAQVGYLSTTTSDVQTQINTKLDSAIDIQTFSASGTWTKPSGNYKKVTVYAVGAGGGGASGRRATSGTYSGGGGGGAGGAPNMAVFGYAGLGNVTVTIGAGGALGAAQSGNDQDGNNGFQGGDTTFGTHLTALGGGLATRGTNATASNGGSTVRSFTLTAPFGVLTGQVAGSSPSGGRNGNSTGGLGGDVLGPGTSGGGGGGSVTTAPAAAAGGAGGTVMAGLPAIALAGGTAGATAGGNAGNGNSFTPTALYTNMFGGTGGGGGGSAVAAPGGTGGNGVRGGGGGGGGASLNGSNSGAGGTGGDGYMVVITE